MMKYLPLAVVFLTLVCAFLNEEARAEERDLLGVGGGVLGIVDSHKIMYASLEYRPAILIYNVGPWVGLEFSDEFFYGAAGVLMDFHIAESTLLTPSFGVGYYPENGNVDLGGDLQFRTTFELSHKFPNSGRLGIAWSHISNGGIYDINPGTEIIKITYYIPVGKR